MRFRSRSGPFEDVFAQDEHRFAWSSHAELFPREALDRAGVRAKGVDLGGEAAVLCPEIADLPLQGLGSFPLLEEVEQSAVAEQGADHEGDRGEDRAEDQGLPTQAGFGARAIFAEIRQFNLYLRK